MVAEAHEELAFSNLGEAGTTGHGGASVVLRVGDFGGDYGRVDGGEVLQGAALRGGHGGELREGCEPRKVVDDVVLRG